jgi:hypothetical protein
MSVEAMPIILRNYIGIDELGNEFFDFERIVPIGDVPDWYDQRLEKWGTKWAGYSLCISDTDIDFFTAWVPPLPIIAKLAELHKDLVFRLEYYEVGMAFRGIYTAQWGKEGLLIEDNDWNMTKKDLKELGFL